MKRLCKILFTLTLCLGLFIAVSANAEAKTISGVSAVNSRGKITVSGTAKEGTLACAVLVYDSSESTLLDMETCPVNEDSSFRYQMSNTYEDGTYVVKVADYDGSDYAVAKVTVKTDGDTEEGSKQDTAKETKVLTSPKTGDTGKVFLWGVPVLMMLAALCFATRKRSH